MTTLTSSQPVSSLDLPKDTTVLDDIRELNLSYLLLAQRLLRDNEAVGMLRLGLSKEVARLLKKLSLAQTVRLASGSEILCRFRLNESIVLSAMNEDAMSLAMNRARVALHLAHQPVEQVG